MIEVKNLTKVFKKAVRESGIVGMIKTLFSTKYESITAVNNINFTIHDGEIVGYIGSNGAGKSTTIKMMSGILTPTSGQVLIDGLEPYRKKTRNKVLKNVGVVFGQRTQLWWDLPLNETFYLLQKVYEVSDEDFEERFNYLRKILELDKFLTQPVRTLSLGQRMRADLAASLIHNPKVLFLDEPTIGLDVLVKEKVIQAIKEINQKYQTSIILTTHDLNDITNLCSRIIIIDEGNVIYDGSIDDIKNKFGDIRNLYISTKDRINEECLNDKFNNILEFNYEHPYLKITFDASKIEISKLTSEILTSNEVLDFKITENNIENVVKQIYANKHV